MFGTDSYGATYYYDLKTDEIRKRENQGLQTEKQKNQSRNYSTLIMYGLLFLSGYLFLKTSPPVFSVLIISAIIAVFVTLLVVIPGANKDHESQKTVSLSNEELKYLAKTGLKEDVKMIFLFIIIIAFMIFLLHFTITVMPNHIFRLLMEVMVGFIPVFIILLLDFPAQIKLYYRILKS